MILQEKRSIKTGKDAVDLLQNGKLAGQLGGKKFIPSWIVEDPKTFEDLVNLTLDILGKDPNAASDEVIQLLIKYSFTDPNNWVDVIQYNKDTVIELSKALATGWFKQGPWQEKLNKLLKSKFNSADWRDLEHDIQDAFSKRQAKKGKTISNTSNLYDTLYDDGTWKLCVPKCFEGDVELASHIKPFKYSGSTYTKTRWCTAAQKSYYDRYTNEGKNKLYVIQYWEDGVYTEAYQLAFDKKDHIEFMDKNDEPVYQFVRTAPKELLKMIIGDNPTDELLRGVSLADLFELSDDVSEAGKKLRLTVVSYDKDGYGVNRIGEIVNFGKALNLKDEELVIGFDNSQGYKFESININGKKFAPIETLDIPNIRKVFIEYGPVMYNFFQKTDNLEEVVCGPKAEDIRGNFNNCKKLKKFDAGGMHKGHYSSVKIEDSFNNCPALEVVNLREVAYYKSFKNCPNIKDAKFNAELNPYTDGFAKTVEHLIIGCKEITDSMYLQAPNLIELEILPTTEKIETCAFESCENLVNVKFPKGTKVRVDTAAFLDCKNLEFVENIESIEGNLKRIFAGCSKLKF